MFFSEEDVEPAVRVARQIFGKDGIIADLRSSTKFHNVSVATREFGKIWYGDIDCSEGAVKVLVQSLSKQINKKVYILDDMYDFAHPLMVSE